MHRPLIAVVLYVSLHAVAAESGVRAPNAAAARQGVPAATKTMPSTAPVRPANELIKTASAGTHKPAPVQADTFAASAAEDPPRRGGTAMLFAALALMLGIVLRRYGAHR